MSLPKVRTHKNYQEFVKEQLTLRGIDIPFIFRDAFIKLFHLDLSPVSLILKDRYSHQGAPARNPQDMLRSLLAMTLLGVTSIDEWVTFLRSFPSLAIISGFTPGVGSFYDFFDRLYLMEKRASKAKGKARFKRKPRKKQENKR